MPSDWSAAQYLKFADERTRPARDLLAQVPPLATGEGRVPLVVDLGCGPGNSTELLAERFPEAEIYAFDTSPDMIETARARLPPERFPHVRFALDNGATFELERPAALIFANAVLQWLPHHAPLLRRLVSLLAPGGTLAVQMPDNLEEPSHTAIREVAFSGPWAERLRDAVAGRAVLPTTATYYDMLAPITARLDLWHTIYNHPLEDAAAIVEWFKGTALRPFLDALDPSERSEFLETYRQRLEAPYPRRADGKVLLAFPRFFIVARK